LSKRPCARYYAHGAGAIKVSVAACRFGTLYITTG
jgi:hypothetical protein